ncbi:hypothetical protein [Sedimentitalea todarodis]|uniref:Uncharacterized protein n=1 Tax=Sedimentitalea todarodis TaxID=1631240 RepID=A0ABU3VBS3_9RHOB|nr:hypothetical protein [Sedimentitalea todarodis]MDU9003638.1 hypothetical protein [Sedimentitalea todarodis]
MTQQRYLYTGDCKTWSTAIQTMLEGKRYRMPGIKLMYPKPVQHGMLAHALTTRKHLKDKRWGRNRQKPCQPGLGRGGDLDRTVRVFFPRRIAAAIKQHLPDYAETIRAIAYIRPHVGRFLSQFAENLKNGQATGEMQEFARESFPARR